MTEEPAPSAGRIEVILSEAPPECGRCGRAGILSIRIPQPIVNARGETIKGTTIVVLCSHCDLGQPEAGALITWFTVHGQITGENLAEAAERIDVWALIASVPPLNEAALEAEVQEWRDGNL